MTTRVTIDPANHRIQVTEVNRMEDGSKKLTDLTPLEPNTSPWTGYVWDGKSLIISEITE